MKKVKLKIVGTYKGFCLENFLPYKILKERYDVIVSDDADYVFCLPFDDQYEICKYNGIRIFFSGENVPPDFAIFDYGISFDLMEYQDRYYRFPLALNYPTINKLLKDKNKGIDESILKEKEHFASFVYSHEGCPQRTKIFNELSKYKHVVSPGKYLHNADIAIPYGTEWNPLIDFERKFKFVIASENNSFPGYVTEKIACALAAKTIPIYFGDPYVNKIFNPEAFINLSDYSSVEEMVDHIRKIDQDDKMYLDILRKPAFVDDKVVQSYTEGLRRFLFNIFDQEYDFAFRRPTSINCIRREKRLLYLNELEKKVNDSFSTEVKRASKKMFKTGASFARHYLKKIIK